MSPKLKNATVPKAKGKTKAKPKSEAKAKSEASSNKVQKSEKKNQNKTGRSDVKSKSAPKQAEKEDTPPNPLKKLPDKLWAADDAAHSPQNDTKGDINADPAKGDTLAAVAFAKGATPRVLSPKEREPTQQALNFAAVDTTNPESGEIHFTASGTPRNSPISLSGTPRQSPVLQVDSGSQPPASARVDSRGKTMIDMDRHLPYWYAEARLLQHLTSEFPDTVVKIKIERRKIQNVPHSIRTELLLFLRKLEKEAIVEYVQGTLCERPETVQDFGLNLFFLAVKQQKPTPVTSLNNLYMSHYGHQLSMSRFWATHEPIEKRIEIHYSKLFKISKASSTAGGPPVMVLEPYTYHTQHLTIPGVRDQVQLMPSKTAVGSAVGGPLSGNLDPPMNLNSVQLLNSAAGGGNPNANANAKRRRVYADLPEEVVSSAAQSMHKLIETLTDRASTTTASTYPQVAGLEADYEKYYKVSPQWHIFADGSNSSVCAITQFLRRFPKLFELKSDGLGARVKSLYQTQHEKELFILPLEHLEDVKGSIPKTLNRFEVGAAERFTGFCLNLLAEARSQEGSLELEEKFPEYDYVDAFVNSLAGISKNPPLLKNIKDSAADKTRNVDDGFREEDRFGRFAYERKGTRWGAAPRW